MKPANEEFGKSVRYLCRLFEVTDGNGTTRPKITELGREVGLNQEESFLIVSELEERGLVTTSSMGERVAITEKGATAVDALSPASADTNLKHAGSTNVINIFGDVHGSPIQQATQHSTQQMTTTSTATPGVTDKVSDPIYKERLYANVLPVASYPPRVYLADTPYRFRGDLFREIQRLTSKSNVIWTLK